MEELDQLFEKLKEAGQQLHAVEVQGDIKDFGAFIELCAGLLDAENVNFNVDAYGCRRGMNSSAIDFLDRGILGSIESIKCIMRKVVQGADIEKAQEECYED